MPDDDGAGRARVLVRALGVVVIGGALVAAAAGTLTGRPVLAGLGLVIAAEEALEIAVVAGALRLTTMPRVKSPAVHLRLGPTR